METLKELKNKYKELQKEADILYKKIGILEKEEASSKFTVGDCYLDTKWNNLLKIISIRNGCIHCICLDENTINRDNFYISEIKFWEKITSQQFKDAYLAVIKDIQDPDLDDTKESNWGKILKSVIESTNNHSAEKVIE